MGNALPAASRRSSTGCWHLGLGETVEDLAVQELVVERAIEALVIAILPRRALRDVERLHADLLEPLPGTPG
jgi:hypothetical protein